MVNLLDGEVVTASDEPGLQRATGWTRQVAGDEARGSHAEDWRCGVSAPALRAVARFRARAGFRWALRAGAKWGSREATWPRSIGHGRCGVAAQPMGRCQVARWRWRAQENKEEVDGFGWWCGFRGGCGG